jgi:hypothetical protein
MSSVFRTKNQQDAGIDNVFFLEKSSRKMYTIFSVVQRQQRKSDLMTFLVSPPAAPSIIRFLIAGSSLWPCLFHVNRLLCFSLEYRVHLHYTYIGLCVFHLLAHHNSILSHKLGIGLNTDYAKKLMNVKELWTHFRKWTSQIRKLTLNKCCGVNPPWEVAYRLMDVGLPRVEPGWV